MKNITLILLTALTLIACNGPAPVVVNPAPSPVVSPAPAPTPGTDPMSANPRLGNLNTSLVTVTTPAESVVKISLTDPATSVWLRVILPSGAVSEVTTSPAGAFIGLYPGLRELSLKLIPGLRVEVATNLVVPDWKTAATTN